MNKMNEETQISRSINTNDNIAKILEEMSRLHNKLDAMNSYYANVITKTLNKETNPKAIELSKKTKKKENK